VVAAFAMPENKTANSGGAVGGALNAACAA